MKNHIPLSVKKVLTTLLPEMKMSVHEKLVDKNKLKLILPHTTD